MATPLSVASCRFHINGVEVRVIYCPEAEISRIDETLPRPERLTFLYPKEEPGPGVFQVEVRQRDQPSGQRAEVADTRDAQHPVECAFMAK